MSRRYEITFTYETRAENRGTYQLSQIASMTITLEAENEEDAFEQANEIHNTEKEETPAHGYVQVELDDTTKEEHEQWLTTLIDKTAPQDPTL